MILWQSGVIKMQSKKNNDNLKATIAFGVASFASNGINYLVTPIFTRILSTSEYGTISVYNAISSIVMVIATLTLSKPGILSIGMYEHKDCRWRYLSSMLGLITISSAIVGLILGIIWIFSTRLINFPVSLVVLIVLNSWLNPAMVFWTYKQKYEYKYKLAFWILVSTAVTSQMISLAVVFWASKQGNYNLASLRLWSAASVNLVVSLVLGIYILVNGKKIIDIQLWKNTLVFALPLIPHYLGFAFLNGTDRIMINAMAGSDKAGIYSLAVILSTVGSLLWQALCVTFTPFMNEKIGNKDFKKIRKAIKPLLILIGAVCIGVSLLAPEIIGILGTEDYREGVYVVPATVAGVFMHIVYDMFSHISFFHKKSGKIMRATIIAAMSNVILNYLFIKQFGYIAASYTTLVSFLILAIMHYQNVISIEKESVFDIQFICICSAAVITLCLLSNFIYSYAVIRYILFALLGVSVFMRYKWFVNTIIDMGI